MTALSVAAWGHSSTMGHVSRSPLRSRTVGFPESGSDLGSARHFSDVDLPSRPWGSSAGAHPPPRSPPVYPHPCPERDGSCRNIGAIIRHHSLTVMLRSAECPEPLCLWWASPRHRVFSENTSEDVTLPSSLLRAHAPDHVPPPASRHCPWPGGLCRLSPVPAGRWPFPTLSRNPCVGAWTHTPPRFLDACAHCFSKNIGLTSREIRSAREVLPCAAILQGAVFEAAVIR